MSSGERVSNQSGDVPVKDARVGYEDEHGNQMLAPWMIPPDEAKSKGMEIQSRVQQQQVQQQQQQQSQAAGRLHPHPHPMHRGYAAADMSAYVSPSGFNFTPRYLDLQI
jgi:hypothetical protein